ncbi:MAG TPA: NAD-dependent epimerase/dehydratase family protein [Candidatus Thermoplasmatota archaeon]|nr:NAD-dependent epimerase/dehydratase family protein [Candidatus Thermoplasmatota archaeon]
MAGAFPRRHVALPHDRVDPAGACALAPRMGRMRYLVTGCAGFIASRVAQQLLERGHEVVGVDDMNDAYDPRLKEWRLEQLRRHASFRFMRADVADIGALAAAFADGPVEGVYNLAARAGVRQSIADPWTYLRTNAQGTLNVLELARKHDVNRIVTASTSSLYGKHNPRPFRESADTDRPLSPYASSKKAAESFCASYAHIYGLSTPVCRYFTVYGPAGRPDMSMFRFIRWISEGEPILLYGDGSQERDFTYVDDIARGTQLALEKTRGFDVYNLGGDRPVLLRDMIGLIEKLVGKPAKLDQRPAHVADVPATWADITRARTKLGWEPTTSFEDGVRATVKWYQMNHALASNLSLGVDA